uniref:Uncharacterized protein n=1 Tax=viral metagenome TaxID=1070528 RepID=A0A6M3XT58_9ZZZZ
MKKYEIKIGGIYIAKISQKLTRVRVEEAHGNGGWYATNMETGRQVRIKSAAKLRRKAGNSD